MEEDVVRVLRMLRLEEEAALGMGRAADLTGVIEKAGTSISRPSSSDDSFVVVWKCSSLTFTMDARVPVVN